MPDRLIAVDAPVAVLVNPAAGDDDPPELPESVRVEKMSETVELGESLRRLVADGAAVIGVVGGDGSTGCAAGVAADSDVTLWPVPGGTLNHFSRDLGIATVEEAVAALAGRRTRRVDLGEVAGVAFVNNASIGMYADLVRHREHLEARLPLGKWSCAAIATMRTVGGARAIHLEIDGRPESAFMVFVGNNRYEGLGEGTRPRMDEGLLDVVVLRAPRRLARVTLIALSLSGRLTRSRFVRRTAVSEVHVRLAEASSLAHDGEARPIDGEVTFRSRVAALEVIVP